MSLPLVPKPKVRAIGTVRYACASCKALMEPAEAVIRQGRSWHPDHAPKET